MTALHQTAQQGEMSHQHIMPIAETVIPEVIPTANALHAELRTMTATARNADIQTSIRDGLGKTIRIYDDCGGFNLPSFFYMFKHFINYK